MSPCPISNLELSLSSSLTVSDPGTLSMFGELFNIFALDPLLPTLLIIALCLHILSVLTYHSLVLGWELFWTSIQSPSPLDPSTEVVLTDMEIHIWEDAWKQPLQGLYYYPVLSLIWYIPTASWSAIQVPLNGLMSLAPQRASVNPFQLLPETVASLKDLLMDSGSMPQNQFVTFVTSGHRCPSLTYLSQHYQLQGRDAGQFMLHHSTAHNTMMNYYLLGTDSLAPVQCHFGMLGLINPAYENAVFTNSKSICLNMVWVHWYKHMQ